MATEADIPVPICETRGEQVGIFVDNIINISVSKLSLEKHDQFNEHPTVEGENFLRPPSIGEVDHEVNNVTPDVSKVTEEPEQAVKDDGTDALLPSSKLDDQPVDAAANEEISAVEIQQNGAESNSTEKDGDNGTDSSFTKEEDDVTDHSIPSVAEKSEEAALAQVKDSQIECDEHLEEESERLPSTQVSTGEINDSIPEAQLSENEPRLSDLSQNNSKQENTIEAEEATVDRQKESLENLSVGEAHTEINNAAPDISEATEEPDQTERDDKKVEFSANEEISVEEIQPNAEELNSTEKDSSVVTSDDAEVVTQLSKDTSIDQHGANDSYTENTALNKKILEETNIPSEETESLTPCIKEGEELIVQVKTTDKQSEDEKTEDVSNDLTSEVSKEEESDQNKTSSEQEVLANETSVEDKSNTAAGEASQDDSASKETTTTLELQGKSESNSSNSKEEETTAEKPEESSLVQNEDSKIDCDEQLEEEGERLPLTEVSTGATNDNIPPVTDVVEDLKEVEKLSENEAGTCTSVKEDKQIETHAESLLVAPEVIEESNLSQENSINEVEEATIDQQKECLESLPLIVSSSPDEGSTNAVLQVVTSEHTDEKTIDKVDKHAEVLENLTIGEAHSEINNFASDISEVTEKPDQTVTDGTDTLLLSPKLDDQPVESAADEIQQNAEELNSTENITLAKEISEETDIPIEETASQAPCIAEGEELNVQVKTTDNKSEDEKPTEEDKSCNVTSEVSKEGESDQNKTTSEHEVFESERSVEDNSNTEAGETSRDDSASKETTTTLELQSKGESNSSLSKEEETTVEKGDRSLTAEKSEESSLAQIEDSKIECDEHLEEEGERLPLTEVSTGATNDNVPPVTDVVEDKDEDLKEVELSENESGTCTSVKEDEQIETHAQSLLVAPEVIEESNLSQENSINEVEEATIDAVDQQKECLESFPSIVSSSPDEGSTNAVLQEVTSDHTDEKTVDKHAEVLENLTIGEAHSEINNFAPDISEVTENPDQTVTDGTDTLLLSPKLDDQPVESAADEIQQNAEEFNSTEKDGDRGVVPENCSTDSLVETSELKVGEKLDDLDVDDARVATQLSKDTSTENITLAKEISKETDIPIEETAPQAPCIAEGEELNGLVKTTDNKSEDEKPTEEDKLCNVTREVSKEGESDQNKTTSEHEVFQSERSVEDNSNTEAGEASRDDSASKETITTLELQSKSESNSSISKEEDTTAEKPEESSLVQIENSKIDCDEHLEEEGERLPLIEVSTGTTNDNVPPVTEVVEDKDEDLKEVELSENEAGTCTSVKEDKQIETHAESLLVAPEVIEESNLSQENSINEVEEATIDAVDQQKECLESFPSIVSSSPDEGSTNAVLQEVTSDHTDEKTVDKHAEVLENLTIGEAHSEINNFAPDISEVTENPDQTVTDGTDTLLLSPKLDDQPVESAADEIQQNAEELNSTEKDGDRGVVPEKCSTDSLVETSEVKVGEKLDDLDVDDARVATQLSKDTSTENTTLAKEISEETDIPIEETAPQAPCIAEGEELNGLVKTTDNKSEDEKPTEEDKSCNVTREVSKEGESDQNKTTSEHEVFQSERSVEDNSNTEAGEASRDDSASKETITTLELQTKSDSNSSISKEEDTTAEKPEESSLVQIEDSKIDCDEHLEEEGERLPLIEVSTGTTNDNVPPVTDVVEDKDEDLKEVELSENEADTCTEVKEDKQIETQAESLLVAPEVIEEPNLSQEQSTDATLHGNMNEADEATINDVVDQQKESLESLSTPVSTEDDIGKEREDVPLPLPLAREISDEPKLLHEAQIDDGESKIAEFCDTETSTESMLNTEDSLHVTSEDNKAPDLSQEIETRTAIEEQDSSTHPQGILEKRSDSQIVDEAEIKEDPLENVSNEVSDKDLLIEEPKTANECLSTVEVPNERSTDCTTPNKENLQDAPEDHKTPTSSEATETTLSLEEQSLAENSQEIIGNSIIEAADKKELAVENVSTEIPYEHIEESTKIEEADVEKPVDSLQVKPEDIKQHDSNLDINNSIEEQIQDTDPREISSDNTEREPVDAVDTSEEILEAKGIAENNLDCDKDAASYEVPTKNTEGGLIKEEESIELEKSIEPPLLGQDRETNCLDEQSPTANTEGVMDDTKEDIADNATGSEEETPKDKENIANTTLHEDKEENTPSTEAPKVYTTESSPVEEEEEQVENSVEEEIITANPQEKCNKTQEKFVDAADEKEVCLEEEDVAINVPHGDKEDNLPIEVDGSQKPSSEEAQTEKIDDDEPTAVHEASSANEKTVKANLFEDEKNIENALAKEEVATSSVQDREASYLEEQAPTTNSQLADEKEEIVEDKNCATTPYEDTVEESLIQVDGSLLEQKEHSEMDNESTSSTDAPKDTITESISVREVAQVEDISSNKIAEKTIEETSKETQEAQDIAKSVPHEEVLPNVGDGSQNAYLVEGSVGIIDEHESTTSQDEQILSADPREVIDDNKTIDPIDFQKETPADEVPKEIETVDVKATSIELKEEEGYLVAAHQEKSSNLTAEKTPCAEDLNVNRDIIGYIPEVRDDEQHEPSITEVSEEHVTTSLEEPEVSENNNDQVVGEANSCGDRTESEKIEVSNDGYIAVPTNETLAETDPRESTEAEVNGEEKTDSNNCDEISGSNNSVASQEVSTSNVAIEADSTCNSSQEPGKETREETETEEPQKQDSELQVSEDSTVENIERDAQPFLESADDSGITEEVQNLQESVPLPAPEENITTECKESDVVEEKNETSKVDHSTTETELTNRDDEKEACEEKIPDISSAAPDLIQARDTDVVKSTDNSDNVIDTAEVPVINENTSVECVLVNERSVTDLETKHDDEAPEIKETTPSSAEGQDVEENSNTPGSLTEEKSDSDEVTPVQSCDIISETEERKTEEDNLKAEAEIEVESVKAVADDTSEQEETTCEKEILKDDIPSEKEQLLRSKAEDEDIKDYNQGSCEEEVVRDSHQEDEISKETVELIKDGSHTEMVSKAFEEADDEAPEELEEKILTNEANDKIFHQEEQETSIEEPTTKIDTVKAHELAIASVNTDTGDSDKEGVQKEESEEQNNKDEICSSGEIQAKDEESKEEAKETDTWTKPNEDEDEEKEAYAEDKKLDFASQTEGLSECTVIDGAHIPEDNENSTISEDIALTEQASEAAIAIAEVQEAKATGIESREVDEVNDKCVANIKDSDVQMAEKDDVVNLQSARELSNESFEVSSNETSEGQETKPVQNAPAVSETLEEETEKINSIPNQLESSIPQSSVEDTAQHEKREGSQQIDSDIKTFDVAELKASPLPLKDKHVVLEADDAKNLNQVEHEIEKPSKVEQEEAECGNEERKPEPEDTGKPSLSELFQVSMRGTAATEKEPTSLTKDLHAENSDEAEQENSKTDEEKDDEEESHEQQRSDSVSEAPVMVDMEDADVKVAHKKSHNILSGVGSKVKHSIAKVKKAITGKSSHPKPPSPKKVAN